MAKSMFDGILARVINGGFVADAEQQRAGTVTGGLCGSEKCLYIPLKDGVEVFVGLSLLKFT